MNQTQVLGPGNPHNGSAVLGMQTWTGAGREFLVDLGGPEGQDARFSKNLFTLLVVAAKTSFYEKKKGNCNRITSNPV